MSTDSAAGVAPSGQEHALGGRSRGRLLLFSDGGGGELSLRRQNATTARLEGEDDAMRILRSDPVLAVTWTFRASGIGTFSGAN